MQYDEKELLYLQTYAKFDGYYPKKIKIFKIQ